MDATDAGPSPLAATGGPAPSLDWAKSAAALTRIVGGVAVVSALSLLDEPRRVGFGYAVAFGWIPVAGLLEAVRRRWPGAVIDATTLVADVAFLFSVLIAFDGTAGTVLVALTLVVGFHAYVGGRRRGLIGAALAVAAVYGGEIVAEQGPAFSAFTLALFPLVVGAIAVLASAVEAERTQLSGGLARLRHKADLILTGVAESVMVSSPRGRIRQWNSAAERTFACARGDAVTKSCNDVLGLHYGVEELDCSRGCALLEARLRTEDDLQVWRLGPTGDRQPLLAHVSPLLDDDGAVVEVVHSFRDITALMRADEAKTRFLATATHELKTPLTVIMGFTEFLQRQSDLPAPQRDEALRSVHDRARQLAGIVDRLLMTSRIEAGRIALELRPVLLGPMLADVAGTLGAATGRIITVDVPPGLPVAYADPQGFATVVEHLLENAVKYSESGTPITVSAEAADEFVEVRVRDEGMGMTPAQIEHCFERFWQGETGDSRRFSGTGIGLYIVRSLADAMRASVTVESAPGEGATFRLRLLRPEAADALAAAGGDGEAPALERQEPSIIKEFMRQVGVPGGAA